MRCLNCNAEMVNYDVTTKDAELSYDVCERCGSLWLDAGELDKMAFQVQGSIEFCSEDPDQSARPSRNCPRCDDCQLVPVRFLGASDIVLDHCRNCGGFWLDGGELNLVDQELTKIMPVEGHGFSDFVNNVHVPFWSKRLKRPSSETDFKVAVAPVPGAEHKGQTSKACPADGTALDLYSLAHVEFEGCPKCHGMWLDKDELRKLKNTVNDGQLHWLNREVDNVEKVSSIVSSRNCPKCPSIKLRSIVFGHSGVVIDSCPDCHGIWLDRGEFDSIVHFLHDDAANATPKEIGQELREDLRKAVTGEGPETRMAELGDAAAAIAALANTVIFDHPAFFNFLSSASRSARSVGLG
ncbi:MAG TPA: zf-TFIIB domain-containing protein [Chthoniobacterales bacterium]|nr:zf-TFIIB domain-containing protein [Chthoniobacterales bacterium]